MKYSNMRHAAARRGRFAAAAGRHMLYCSATGVALAGLLTSTAAAQAADSSGNAGQPTANAPVLQEVIVTAEKRSQNIQDVPASVTAITANELATMGATGMADYVAKVPGLVLSNVSSANGTNQISIRGITTGVGGNPTVGIYIDDSPFGGSNGFAGSTIPDLDPFDLERIEVLQGPQGTLYGAGSLGGLVKFVTVKPSTQKFYGDAAVDGSQVDGGGTGYGVHGGVNIPLSDSVALRVSGFDRKDPGFIDDAVRDARNVNSARVEGGHAALLWRINGNWTVNASALQQRHDDQGTATVDYNSLTFQPLYGDLRQVRAPGTGARDQEIDDYELEIHGDLGWATLTSASSYNQERVHFNLDVTPIYAPVLSELFGVNDGGSAILTDSSLYKYTEELRLASPSEDRLSWLVGTFFTHEYTTDHQYIGTFDDATGGPLSTPLPSLLDAELPTLFQEWAVFGDLTYRVTPRFDLTGGLRYSQNQQDQVEVLTGLLVPAGTTPGGSRDHSITFLATPHYHISHDTMAYARISSGYRPGGPNLAVSGVPLAYGPDKVVNYELGVKSELPDQRMTVDAAIYYINWSHIQVNEISPAGLNYFGNVGGARSKGAQASIDWQPIGGLDLNGNVSYTLAQLTTDMPAGGGAVGYAGDRLPDSPKWSAELSADYRIALWSDWIGLAGASYSYVGNRFGEFSSTTAVPRFPLPSYQVIDLRTGIADDRWKIMLYAKNVGDSHGLVDNYLLGPFTSVSIIQPRTFGISIDRSF